MVRISVVTPTIRPHGLALTSATLAKQTFRDFEWRIGSPFNPHIPDARWIKDTFTGGKWTLNRMQTKLCQEAKGELIVFLQDYIWVIPEGLQKFWDRYRETGGLISGIGDKYDTVSLDGTVGNVTKPDVRRALVKGDETFFKVDSNEHRWEINWGCCSKEDIAKVGYFVDEADFVAFGGDSYMAAERMHALLGMDTYIDATNENFGVDHARNHYKWDDRLIDFTDYFKNKEYMHRKQDLVASEFAS
jgi:hypothetical protein